VPRDHAGQVRSGDVKVAHPGPRARPAWQCAKCRCWRRAG
jgi:hypothetical protein